MATVNGYTKEKTDEVFDENIVDGAVVSGDLILEKRSGATINAGSVIGPQGLPGTNGTNGSNGAPGPAGPTALVGDPVLVNTVGTSLSTSGVISGLSRTNVPVVVGHTYGLNFDFSLSWSSLDVDAEWHLWVRLNGVNLERFTVLKPVVLGISYQHCKGQVFWDAPATQSTDDFDVWAEEIIDGANITPSGAATLRRKFWIVDYGVVT